MNAQDFAANEALMAEIANVSPAVETAATEPAEPAAEITERAATIVEMVTTPAAPVVINYDALAGQLDADGNPVVRELPTIAERQAEQADAAAALLADAMSSPEARMGTDAWNRELAKRERERRAQEESLERMAEMRDYIASKLVFAAHMRETYLDVLTLWALHSYSYRAAGVTPYLYVTAATMNSGKTQVERMLYTLVGNPSPIVGSLDLSPAALSLIVAEGMVLFVDEADKMSTTQVKALAGTLNTGYASGGARVTVANIKGAGKSLVKTKTFGPKVIAGIARDGSLPLPEDTLSRGIEIKMVEATSEEQRAIGRFDQDVYRDEPEVLALRDWMQTWTHAQWAKIRDHAPDMPKLSTSRATQIWASLVSLGDLLGGDWGQRIRAAAVSLDTQRETPTDPNSLFAADVQAAIDAWVAGGRAPGATRIETKELHEIWLGMRDRQFTESLDAGKFGRRMGALGIKSTPDKGKRFYSLVDNAGAYKPEVAEIFARLVKTQADQAE